MKRWHIGKAGLLAALSTLLALAACGGGGDGGGISGTGRTEGTLRLALTDAPACGYDHVYLTVEKVRVHQNAAAGEAEAGWAEIVPNPARRVDLLALSNGVLEELGQTPLPAGRYTQMRLVLAANGASAPFANAVQPSGGAETALTTPSGQQSGLKLDVNLEVAADKVADFVIDFDACKSVVRRGNSGQYNLKPVLSVIPRLSDAGQRIVGWVSPAVAASGAAVSAQQGGVPVKATLADAATGRFVLYPVPAGTYELVISAGGRATAVMTGVPVVTTAHTVVNSEALPIVPPALALPARAVSGTVVPATATLRATQTLTGGPTVEVAWAPVDALTGAFAFSLPQEAPVRLAYVANPVSLPWAVVPGAAGRYTVEASSAGVLKTQPIDTTAPVPALGFSFP